MLKLLSSTARNLYAVPAEGEEGDGRAIPIVEVVVSTAEPCWEEDPQTGKFSRRYVGESCRFACDAATLRKVAASLIGFAEEAEAFVAGEVAGAPPAPVNRELLGLARGLTRAGLEGGLLRPADAEKAGRIIVRAERELEAAEAQAPAEAAAG